MTIRTDKDMALDLLANPPRAVLDGFGRKRGEAWERFQREVLSRAEEARGRYPLRFSLRSLLERTEPAYSCDPRAHNLGPETEEERSAQHLADVRASEIKGEAPFCLSSGDDYIPAGSVHAVEGWSMIPLRPTAITIPSSIAPSFVIRAVRIGRTEFLQTPTPAAEFTGRRRLLLPRIRPGECVQVVAENIDGACWQFAITFWCAHENDPLITAIPDSHVALFSPGEQLRMWLDNPDLIDEPDKCGCRLEVLGLLEPNTWRMTEFGRRAYAEADQVWP